MSYPCEAVEQPVQPVLSIRTRTPVQNLPEVLGNSYQKIIALLTELGESPAGAPFVAYYNMDMQDLDMEIGFPVSRELPGKGEVHSSEIPSGKYATCLYTGPYPEMPPAYEALNAWIQEHSFEPTGVVYEHYLNSPQEVPPQELKTLIAFSLK
jgi:effector-binding domain-containing protein